MKLSNEIEQINNRYYKVEHIKNSFWDRLKFILIINIGILVCFPTLILSIISRDTISIKSILEMLQIYIVYIFPISTVIAYFTIFKIRAFNMSRDIVVNYDSIIINIKQYKKQRKITIPYENISKIEFKPQNVTNEMCIYFEDYIITIGSDIENVMDLTFDIRDILFSKSMISKFNTDNIGETCIRYKKRENFYKTFSENKMFIGLSVLMWLLLLMGIEIFLYSNLIKTTMFFAVLVIPISGYFLSNTLYGQSLKKKIVMTVNRDSYIRDRKRERKRLRYCLLVPMISYLLLLIISGIIAR